MMQPPGFKDKSKPDHVCILRKAIYELKQASRAWYTSLKNDLLDIDFQNSKIDSVLFTYWECSIICYLLVHVNDIVLAGNNSNF